MDMNTMTLPKKGLKDKTIWYGYGGPYSDSTQKGLKNKTI